MALFRRKKTLDADAFTLMNLSIRVEAAMMLETLDSARGGQGFSPREEASAMFTVDFLNSVHVLKRAGQSSEDWWSNSNLDDQWEQSSRTDREELLVKTIQFSNMMDKAEYEDIEPLVVHAAVRLKALLVAYACDGIYGSTFLQQLASDPLSFGVHELSS